MVSSLAFLPASYCAWRDLRSSRSVSACLSSAAAISASSLRRRSLLLLDDRLLVVGAQVDVLDAAGGARLSLALGEGVVVAAALVGVPAAAVAPVKYLMGVSLDAVLLKILLLGAIHVSDDDRLGDLYSSPSLSKRLHRLAVASPVSSGRGRVRGESVGDSNRSFSRLTKRTGRRRLAIGSRGDRRSAAFRDARVGVRDDTAPRARRTIVPPAWPRGNAPGEWIDRPVAPPRRARIVRGGDLEVGPRGFDGGERTKARGT